MKIKIEMTVDVDTKVLRQYMHDLNVQDEETLQEFVRSFIVSGGIGSIEEALFANGYDSNAVELTKHNAWN